MKSAKEILIALEEARRRLANADYGNGEDKFNMEHLEAIEEILEWVLS